MEQAIRRILGIDLKMKQYAAGLAVRPAVVDEAGMDELQQGLDLAGDAADQGRDRRTRGRGWSGSAVPRRAKRLRRSRELRPGRAWARTRRWPRSAARLSPVAGRRPA